MTTYYPFWAILIALSLWASLGGFLWAHKHRQFKDQERARYLPLRGEEEGILVRPGHGAGREAVAMAAILACGVAGLLITLAVVVFRNPGGTP
jgi:nitrogen fixation-related uncharacterized protein